MPTFVASYHEGRCVTWVADRPVKWMKSTNPDQVPMLPSEASLFQQMLKHSLLGHIGVINYGNKYLMVDSGLLESGDE